MSGNDFNKKLTAILSELKNDVFLTAGNIGYIKELNYFYDLLEKKDEKKLFARFAAYKLTGVHEIKKYDSEKRIKLREQFDGLLVDDSVKRLKSATRKLKFYNLGKFGYNLKLYGAKNILDKLVFYNQYSYPQCCVKEGDYVIDAGGCWGDTALLFSLKAGKKGKIFTFEFFQDNLDIMEENFARNVDVSEKIYVIKKPLYDKSNKTLFIKKACADITTLSEEVMPDSKKYKTVCIDDFVKDHKVEKIDFIKMDIEGCELKALNGAEETIKKYRPRLAICAYHKNSDFYEISKFINELRLGYKFYFESYTPGFTDTVLYASAE